MAPDGTTAPGPVAGDAEVMASVDDRGRQSRLVIADISRDGAWLSASTTAAASLRAWR